MDLLSDKGNRCSKLTEENITGLNKEDNPEEEMANTESTIETIKELGGITPCRSKKRYPYYDNYRPD